MMQVQLVRDVMTPNPIALASSSTAADAARAMRDADIGDVIVTEDGQVCGIVTDRDIVVRVVAQGRDPRQTSLADICSRDLTTLSPRGTVREALLLMREKAVRRLPVVEGGRPVGIVSIGDLAVEQEPGSVLGDISSAPPNR